jgi:hypothetical protein
MEPRIENIIRKKIRSAESEPLQWAKHDAWEAIDKCVNKKRTITYYAVAASVVLGALFINFITKDLMQQTLGYKIDLFENKLCEIESVPLKDVAPLSISESPCEDVVGESTNFYTTTKQKRQVVIENETLSEAEEIPLIVFQEDTIHQTEIIQNTLVTETQSVRPIMGIIPVEDNADNSVAVKTKKIRFRFLKSHNEDAFAENLRESKLIIARIK